jgi:hypothetical protein
MKPVRLMTHGDMLWCAKRTLRLPAECGNGQELDYDYENEHKHARYTIISIVLKIK